MSVKIGIFTVFSVVGRLHLRRESAISTIRPHPRSDRLHPSAREGTAVPCGRPHHAGRNEDSPVRGMPFALLQNTMPPPGHFRGTLLSHAAHFSHTPIGSPPMMTFSGTHNRRPRHSCE